MPDVGDGADGMYEVLRRLLERDALTKCEQALEAGETLDLDRMCDYINCLRCARDELRKALTCAFVTAHACAPEGRYEVVARFNTIEQMQACYTALVQIMKDQGQGERDERDD